MFNGFIHLWVALSWLASNSYKFPQCGLFLFGSRIWLHIQRGGVGSKKSIAILCEQSRAQK